MLDQAWGFQLSPINPDQFTKKQWIKHCKTIFYNNQVGLYKTFRVSKGLIRQKSLRTAGLDN